ncbi:MAG: PP2C family protein-serine/threonine phosphatase [Pseudomonadota bacterium]
MAERLIEAAMLQGSRKNQQDYIGHIVLQEGRCIAGVLSDGIGGHGNGNYASKIVVESCIRTLDRQRATMVEDPRSIPDILQHVVEKANHDLGQKIDAFPQTKGMGATVVIAVVHDERLFWSSVGDSVLILIRDGKAEQLNESHSLATSLERLRKIGANVAQNRPKGDFSGVLTSALSGGKIDAVDCPEDGRALHADDILLIASDGIETLSKANLVDACKGNSRKIPAEICAGVVDLVLKRSDPKQDNLAVMAIT